MAKKKTICTKETTQILLITIREPHPPHCKCSQISLTVEPTIWSTCHTPNEVQRIYKCVFKEESQSTPFKHSCHCGICSSIWFLCSLPSMPIYGQCVLVKGFIHHSKSSFGLPSYLSKRNLWFYADYWHSNQLTLSNRYHFPSIQELLSPHLCPN